MAQTNHSAAACNRSVLAEVSTGLGACALIEARWGRPIDTTARAEYHHLQLSLLDMAGPARGCFPDAWGPNRFEPIGQMFLTPANQTLRARSHCARQRSIVCTYGPAALDQWLDGGFRWDEPRLAASLDIADAEVRRLLLRIGRELQDPGFASAAMVELIAGQIAIELARTLRGVDIQVHSGGLAPWRLRRIDDYLAEHAGSATLGELAALCQISVRQLSRGFKASRGVSLGTYMAEVRMRLAQRLLGEGLPVKQVAARLGFTSPPNFSTAFQRALGETPRDYRRRVSGK